VWFDDILCCLLFFFFFFFQAEDGIRDLYVTGVQTCALPISYSSDLGGNLRARVGDHRPQLLAGLEDRNGTGGDFDWITSSWVTRSEERRVGKECRSRWSREQ